MNKIIEQLRVITDTREGALQCGGTYSANNLRVCLVLLEEIEGYKGHEKYERVLDALLVIKDNWKSALINHNANESKIIAYNIETGLPIKPDSNRDA
jgi:hypothetical protein